MRMVHAITDMVGNEQLVQYCLVQRVCNNRLPKNVIDSYPPGNTEAWRREEHVRDDG